MVLLGRIAVLYVRGCGRLLQTEWRGLSDTMVSSEKTAEPIEISLWTRTPVGPKKHVLDGVHIGAT